MHYPNERDTQQDILKPALLRANQQSRINQDTQTRYEQLSYFEKEELVRWLKINLSKIPMPSQIKRAGFEKLMMGDYHCPSTLSLIRHTLKALGL